MSDHLYSVETAKSPAKFTEDFGEVVSKYGFIIHNENHTDMAHLFGEHGADVAESFDMHMIQICKPEKSSKSLQVNPERAILMPKFVTAFAKDDKTQVRFFYFSEDNIKAMVDDQDFPGSLAKTYKKIISMIDEAVAA